MIPEIDKMFYFTLGIISVVIMDEIIRYAQRLFKKYVIWESGD